MATGDRARLHRCPSQAPLDGRPPWRSTGPLIQCGDIVPILSASPNVQSIALVRCVRVLTYAVGLAIFNSLSINRYLTQRWAVEGARRVKGLARQLLTLAHV